MQGCFCGCEGQCDVPLGGNCGFVLDTARAATLRLNVGQIEPEGSGNVDSSLETSN